MEVCCKGVLWMCVVDRYCRGVLCMCAVEVC